MLIILYFFLPFYLTLYYHIPFALVDSHFRWCLDEEMLKKHKLIVPSDLFEKVRTTIDGPSSKFARFISRSCKMRLL